MCVSYLTDYRLGGGGGALKAEVLNQMAQAVSGARGGCKSMSLRMFFKTF